MTCPYPDELLEKWDGICNPIGNACGDCDETECEHNLNSRFPGIDDGADIWLKQGKEV